MTKPASRTEFLTVPPLGVTAIAQHGYQTRKGCQFGVGPLHKLLTNPVYIGRGRYSIRSSVTGGKHPKGEIIEFQVLAIIEQSSSRRSSNGWWIITRG